MRRASSWSISSIRATRGAADRARGGPKLVWIETPSNPLLRIVDIRAIADAAHAAGALVVVDNTFLSPAVAAAARARRRPGHAFDHQVPEWPQRCGRRRGDRATRSCTSNLAWWANAIGVTGAPFDSFLTLRGVRTLHARMRVHAENAAPWSIADPASGGQRVYYPGLADHPGHEIARRQQAASARC
jgi:cystathionine gamma-synthase